MRLLKFWTSEGGCLVEAGAYFWVGAYSNWRQILTPGKGAYSPMFSGLLVRNRVHKSFSLGQGIEFSCSVWNRVGILGGLSGTRYRHSTKMFTWNRLRVWRGQRHIPTKYY